MKEIRQISDVVCRSAEILREEWKRCYTNESISEEHGFVEVGLINEVMESDEHLIDNMLNKESWSRAR